MIKMSLSEKQKKQLYKDALHYHLIHNGERVIKNKYGLFYDKRKKILKEDDKVK
jgi:hypothetical protein